MLLPRLLLAVLAVFACLVAGITLLAVLDRDRDPPAPGASSSEVEDRVGGPRDVLRRWDGRRAEAWASGDPAALRSLYTPRSRAGERDVRMLRRWRDRDMRVSTMQTQVLSSRVVMSGPDRVVLVVTDLLRYAVATGRGRRVVLPTDSPTTRTITLVRDGDGPWRVAAAVLGPE